MFERSSSNTPIPIVGLEATRVGGYEIYDCLLDPFIPPFQLPTPDCGRGLLNLPHLVFAQGHVVVRNFHHVSLIAHVKQIVHDSIRNVTIYVIFQVQVSVIPAQDPNGGDGEGGQRQGPYVGWRARDGARLVKGDAGPQERKDVGAIELVVRL